jgi:TRAP-type uncharacterized transport system substrate-binding protein
MTDQPLPRRAPSRLKIMMSHTWLMLIAAGLACVGVGVIAYWIATQPLTLKIAVGPEGSEDLRIVQAIAAQLGRDRSSVLLSPVITGGSEDSAAAVEKGTADLAVVRRDVAMPKEAQAVAILRRNVVVLFAPAPLPPPSAVSAAAKGKDAKKAKATKAAKTDLPAIEKIEDLSGRRIGIIGRTKANATLLEVILKQYGIPVDKVTVETIPTKDPTAIKEGKVDAVMTVGPVGSSITADAIIAGTRDKEAPTFLTIGAAEAIAERNPIYEALEIKAGAFGGSPPQPEESLDTVGVSHYIVARKDLGEQTIAEFARLLYAVRQTVATEVPAAAKIEAPETGKSSVVTVHPGAAAYIDGTQKSFFDRYSEYFYLGIMLVSFAGSGIAGIVSFSKAGEREDRVEVIDHLVDLIAKARVATSGEELDRLTADVDEIMKTTLHQIEKGEVEDSQLSAFTLALDQARRAIAERRGMLGLASAA